MHVNCESYENIQKLNTGVPNSQLKCAFSVSLVSKENALHGYLFKNIANTQRT